MSERIVIFSDWCYTMLYLQKRGVTHECFVFDIGHGSFVGDRCCCCDRDRFCAVRCHRHRRRCRSRISIFSALLSLFLRKHPLFLAKKKRLLTFLPTVSSFRSVIQCRSHPVQFWPPDPPDTSSGPSSPPAAALSAPSRLSVHSAWRNLWHCAGYRPPKF